MNMGQTAVSPLEDTCRMMETVLIYCAQTHVCGSFNRPVRPAYKRLVWTYAQECIPVYYQLRTQTVRAGRNPRNHVIKHPHFRKKRSYNMVGLQLDCQGSNPGVINM